MASILAAPEARTIAVLLQGRGADGALGSQAQNRSIPANRFRRWASCAPLRDPGADPSMFDRALELRWSSDDENPTLDNPDQDIGHAWARASISVAYLYGDALTNRAYLWTSTGETLATSASDPEGRAVNDGRRIKRALECCDLMRDGTGESTDPPVLDCLRETAEWVDLGGGKGLFVCQYRFALEYHRSTVYDP